MSQKKKNNDWLLLALLALAFLGKGPLATPGPRPTPEMMPTDTTPGKTNTDPGNNGKSTDSTTPDNTTPKSQTPDPRLTGGGVPDKSKMQSPPGTMGMPPTFMMPGPFMDNPGVMFAQGQVNLINSQPKTPEGGNTYLVSNLGGTPGASVTTVLYNPKTMMYDTFTNNQYLFTPKSPGMSPGEMIKQPMPPMMMPQPMPMPLPTPPKMMPGMMPLPLSGLVDPNVLPGSTNPLSALMKMLIPGSTMTSPPMMMQPPSGTVPSPLSSKSILPLQDLLNQFGGFGQSALNDLLNAGKNLTGVFNNLQGLVIPSLPGARPVFPDIVV